MKKFSTLLLSVLCTLYSVLSFATSYTWNGATSTAWSTNTNWTPNGTPGSGDNVTIVSATNAPLYNGVAGVTNLTMTSGTLDLNGYTLNVTGTGTFNGGTITNGKINASGTTTTFAGTTFNCKVTAVTANLYLNGSAFNDSTYAEQTGSTNTAGTGGNKYNAFTEIVTSGTGNLYMSYASPYKADTSNATVKFTKKSAAYLYPSRMGTGHQFNGKVILNATTSATGALGMGIASTVAYNGGIEINNPAGTAVFIGSSTSGNQTLASGKKLAVGSGGFASGSLTIYNLVQLGDTTQNIVLTGSAYIYLHPNTVFNAHTYIEAPNLLLNGARFNGRSKFKKTSGNNNASTGGNVFNDSTSFINDGAGYLMLGSSVPDTFNYAASFENKTNFTYIAYNSTGNYFGGNLHLKNTSGSGIRLNYTGTAAYNGNIYVSGAGSGDIYFGVSTGSGVLASGKTIIEGSSGFTAGTLTLRNFTKNGTAAINLDLGNAAITFSTGSTLNGPVTVSAGAVYLNGTTFNGNVDLVKTGSTFATSSGGNTFNGTFKLTHQGTGQVLLTNSSTLSDVFNGDAEFINEASGTGGSAGHLFPVF